MNFCSGTLVIAKCKSGILLHRHWNDKLERKAGL